MWPWWWRWCRERNSGRPVTVEDRVTSAPDGHKSRPPMLADVLTQAGRKATLDHCCSLAPAAPRPPPALARVTASSQAQLSLNISMDISWRRGVDGRRGVAGCGAGIGDSLATPTTGETGTRVELPRQAPAGGSRGSEPVRLAAAAEAGIPGRYRCRVLAEPLTQHRASAAAAATAGCILAFVQL